MKHVMRKALSLLLLAMTLAAVVLGAVSCGSPENLRDVDIDKYITLPESKYLNQTVKIDYVDDVTEETVEEYILDVLKANGEAEDFTKDVSIMKEDVVALWFCGYIDGKPFKNGSNFTDNSATSLDIGSKSFIDGFEDALIGMNINDMAFSKKTAGAIKYAADYTDVAYENTILHLSYTYKYKDGDGVDWDGASGDADSAVIRYDLGEESDIFTATFLTKDADGNFTVTLEEYLKGKKLGHSYTAPFMFDANEDGVAEETSFTIKVESVITATFNELKVTFPEKYENNPDLAGKEATFLVAVNKLTRTEIPELTEEFLKDTLKYESEELVKDDLIADFRAFIKQGLEENRKATIKQKAMAALWEVLHTNVTVKEYPEEFVQQMYDGWMEEVSYYYSYYGAAGTTDKNGTSSGMTIQQFCEKMYGIPTTKTYTDYFMEQSKKSILEQMMFYLIVDEQEITLSDAEKKEGIDAYCSEMVMQYYMNYGQTITAADVLKNYGEDYIVEQVLFNKFYEYMTDDTRLKIEFNEK